MGQIANPSDNQYPIIQYDDSDKVEMHGRDALRSKIVKRELKKAGYKAKIRAFCCHCIFDPYQEGTWLMQVENCTSPDCPLYLVRPTPG